MDLESLTPEQLEILAALAFGSNKPLNFGPFILGAVVDALFCGILLMQYGAYATSTTKDSGALKALVGFVIAINLWGTGLVWAWIWNLFVVNFGTYREFLSVTYLSWFFVINSLAVIAVHIFFGIRAWKVLNCNLLVGVVMFLFAIAAFGGGLGVKIMFAQYNITVYAYKLKVPAYICLSCIVVVDLLITGIILNYLMRQSTINRHTIHLLGRLTRITFESQLPPTVIAVVLLIVYSIKSDSFIIVPLIWVQPKLYGISLLHTLNARESLRPSERGAEMTTTSCTISSSVVQRYYDGRRASGNVASKSTREVSSWRFPTTESVSLSVLDQQDFNGKGGNDDTWNQKATGSRSVLSEERMEGDDARSKSPLV